MDKAYEEKYEVIKYLVEVTIGASPGGATSDYMRDKLCEDARDIGILERVLFHFIDAGEVMPAHDPESSTTYYMPVIEDV